MRKSRVDDLEAMDIDHGEVMNAAEFVYELHISRTFVPRGVVLSPKQSGAPNQSEISASDS